MEENGNSDGSFSPTSLPDPKLQTTPVIFKGKVCCAICFSGTDRKHAKRAGLQRILDVENFLRTASKWQQYDHQYSEVYTKIDGSQDLYGHKSCKSNFLSNGPFMKRQKKKVLEIDLLAVTQQQNQDVKEVPMEVEDCRKSTRQQLKYTTSQAIPECIICNEKKYTEKGIEIPVKMMSVRSTNDLVHHVEKTLLEFAKIHKDQRTKYADAAERILLTKSTKSLFAADIGFHMNECYMKFRSTHWKTKFQVSRNTDEIHLHRDNSLIELLHLVDVHVINRYEVYTLSQLRNCYDEMKGVNSSCRSIDIKEALVNKFGDRIKFGKSSNSHSNVSEYVLPSGFDFVPNAISTLATGGGIQNSMMLKNLARKITYEIQSRPKTPWPPTPHQIIDSEDDVNVDLYNLLALIVNPKSCIDNTGIVRLSESKAIKVNNICQDIESLVPSTKPSLSQVMFSLNLYRKTGSSTVVNDAHDHGHGISYAETSFIQDKWAEWSERQSTYIPSNIKKGHVVTHVVDNIDWKNKNVKNTETHHTNSIVIQQSSIGEDATTAVILKPDYNYKRQEHRSYKGSECKLPLVNFKRGNVKTLHFAGSFIEKGRHECDKSTLETLLWIYARQRNDGLPSNQDIPGWSGFHELCNEKTLPINVCYFPPFTAPPTEMSVIYASIFRSVDIMKELETDYIFMEVDQAIYHKVLDAMFKMEEEGSTIFSQVIPRMGGFHIILCMIRTIFSRFKNVGIVELLSASGLGGKGTIVNALNGGDTKQAITLYKILFEALLRYKIEFLRTSAPESIHDPIKLECVTKQSLQMILDQDNIKQLPKLKGNMAEWMDLLIDMINVLLNMIHFQRIGNWKGFLEVIYEFLPYCFNLNRHNYSRNMSYFYCHMLKLKDENIDAFTYLLNGGFTGSLTGNPHSSIPCDQMIETTVNRASKQTGGLSGKTENRGATEKWMRINHFMSALRENQSKKVRTKQRNQHEDLRSKKKERDEEKVRCVLNCLQNWVPEMWEQSHPITNISTGEIATENMTKEMKSAKRKGEDARDEFISRFTSVSGEKEAQNEKTYYDSIKKQPVTIFASQKAKKRELVIQSNE